MNGADAASTRSLNERLGFGATDRLLVINCDDLGTTRGSNDAVYASLRDGIATTATLMTPCPMAGDAVERYQGEDVGVHLVLNSETATHHWKPLSGAPSLSDSDGFMYQSIFEVWANAALDDVLAECREQVGQALEWGIDVTHLDSHMGTLQLKADYHQIYIEVAREFDLPLRLAPAAAERLFGFEFRGPAFEQGLISTDHFIYCDGGLRPHLSEELRSSPGCDRDLSPSVD